MKKLLFLLLFCHTGLLLSAQTTDPFAEMERRLQQMMQQFGSGLSLDMPNGLRDTSFFFKWDTTLMDGNGSFFFDLTPKGWGTPDSTGWNDMMREFEKLSRGFGQDFFQDPKNNMPADDGALRNKDGEDELLPEEKLRQQEQQKGAQPDKQKQTPAPSKKDKIKTVKV